MIFGCGCPRKKNAAVSDGYRPVLAAGTGDDRHWSQAPSTAVRDKGQGGSFNVVVAYVIASAWAILGCGRPCIEPPSSEATDDLY